VCSNIASIFAEYKIYASTLRYVLATCGTTCTAHCDCCWFIM